MQLRENMFMPLSVLYLTLFPRMVLRTKPLNQFTCTMALTQTRINKPGKFRHCPSISPENCSYCQSSILPPCFVSLMALDIAQVEGKFWLRAYTRRLKRRVWSQESDFVQGSKNPPKPTFLAPNAHFSAKLNTSNIFFLL